MRVPPNKHNVCFSFSEKDPCISCRKFSWISNSLVQIHYLNMETSMRWKGIIMAHESWEWSQKAWGGWNPCKIQWATFYISFQSQLSVMPVSRSESEIRSFRNWSYLHYQIFGIKLLSFEPVTWKNVEKRELILNWMYFLSE